MKKLLIFLLLFCAFKAESQIYQKQASYGFEYKRLAIDSTLHIPAFCGEPTLRGSVLGNQPAIAYDTCGGIFYVFNPSTQLWSTISASAALSQQDGLISGGIVTYSGSGLTYYVSSALYRIGGQLYSSPFATITLDPADGANSRIDLFAVDTTGHAIKITGTAATIPLAPQPDPSSQIGLTTGIKLAPGATTPPQVTSLLIYDENTEWTTSATATANFDNLANPFHGVKGIYVSSYSKNSTISFLGTSKTVDVEAVLRTFIYLNNANYSFQFRFYNGSTAVSNAVTLTSSFGFNSGLYNVYQNVSIPLSSFTWSGITYNKLMVTMTGRGTTGQFYMDYISVEGGTPVIPATDFSNKVDSTSTKKINDSTYVGLYWIKGFSFQRGDTIKIHSSGGGSTTDTLHLSDRINLKKDKSDSTNSISGYTTLYQNSLNQKKTDSINVARLNGGKIDTAHIPQTTIVIDHKGEGLQTLYGNGTDTLFNKRIQAGTNVTLTQNSDSSISINASGGTGTGKVYAGGHLANTNDSTLNADTLANNLRDEIGSKISTADTGLIVANYFNDFTTPTDSTVVFKRGNGTTKSLTITGGGTILNGTGYVKMSGTTPSYDNSTFLDSIRLVTSGLLHTSPAAFALSGKTGVITQTLVNQSPYTILGNNTGSAAKPTFFTNNYGDSLKRSTDSVFRRVNGNWIYQYKDSVGGGGGGVTSGTYAAMIASASPTDGKLYSITDYLPGLWHYSIWDSSWHYTYPPSMSLYPLEPALQGVKQFTVGAGAGWGSLENTQPNTKYGIASTYSTGTTSSGSTIITFLSSQFQGWGYQNLLGSAIRMKFRLPVLSTSTDRFWCTLGTGNTTSLNGAFFEYSDTLNSGNWVGILQYGATNIGTINTSIAPDITKAQEFVILLTPSTTSQVAGNTNYYTVKYYINKVLVGTIGPVNQNLVGTNAGLWRGWGIVKTSGTNARYLYMSNLEIFSYGGDR